MNFEAFRTQPIEEAVLTFASRIKVHIHCKKCGETYILRGAKDERGRVDTGFKRCLCNNDHDFDVEHFV